MNIGVIGNGRLGPALVRALSGNRAPAANLVGWAPVREGGAAPAWLAETGAAAVSDWHALVEQVDSVVVDMTHLPNWHDREVISEAAAAAGKNILVDAPLADFIDVYDRIRGSVARGGGRLWCPRPVRGTLAVEAAVERVRAGGIGTVLALYGSLHLPAAETGGSFGQHTVDLLDAAIALAGGAPERLFSLGNEGAIESTHIVARWANETIATLEIARCLPAGSGQARECVIEVTGSEGFLRLSPNAIDIHVAGEGLARAPWREDGLEEACEAWLLGANEDDARAQADRDLITAMRMAKRARAKGEVMGPDAEPIKA